MHGTSIAGSWTTLSGLPNLKDLKILGLRSSMLAKIAFFKGHWERLVLDTFSYAAVGEDELAEAGLALASRAVLIVVLAPSGWWSEPNNIPMQNQKHVWSSVSQFIWTEYAVNSPLLTWDERFLWPTLVGRHLGH